MDTNIDIDWNELIKSYEKIRSTIGEDVNGPLILQSMLSLIVEGEATESSISDTGLRERVVSLYYDSTQEEEDEHKILDLYNDWFEGWMIELRIPEEEVENVWRILQGVITSNLDNPLFRARYSSQVIADRVLNYVMDLYESRKDLVQNLGKNVGELASSYLY